MGVILVKNNKGGVGKSWLSLQLAAYKSFKNKRVLILTSDSQNNILSFSGISKDTTKKGLEDMLDNKEFEFTKLRENLFYLHLQGYKLKKEQEKDFIKQFNKIKRDFDFIVIDGSPVLGLDNLFIEIAEHIIIPTFLDNVTTKSILNMLRNIDFEKIRAVVPNRIGRTKIEKGYYEFLKTKLEKNGIYLSFPINQSSIISKLIDSGKLIWESKISKLEHIKLIFEDIWKEIENE